jgi:hypothetical protein
MTMLAHNFINRVELSFWDVIIPLMSNSPFVQKIIRHGYAFTRENNTNAIWIPAMIAACAAFGLLAGFTLGHMGISLW